MAIESSKQGDMNVSEAPEGGDFFGQTVLVAGGGGIVGSAVVARVLREGGTVFAPVRSERSVEKLRELLEGGRVPLQRLKAFVADYGSKPGALRLVNFLNTHAQRGLNHVISIHGEKHESAKLAEITGAEFLDTMATKVLPHIVVAQATAPHVIDRAEASYTIVSGRMGETCEAPEQALLCIANAATFGVAAALRAQCHQSGVSARVLELRLGVVVKRDDAHENPGFPGWRAHNASSVASFWAQKVALGRAGGEEAVLPVGERELGQAPEAAQAKGKGAGAVHTAKAGAKEV